MTSKAHPDYKRIKWLAAFENLVVAADPTMSGRIDWDTAIHLFNTGLTPEQAAPRAIRKAAVEHYARVERNWLSDI